MRGFSDRQLLISDDYKYSFNNDNVDLVAWVIDVRRQVFLVAQIKEQDFWLDIEDAKRADLFKHIQQSNVMDSPERHGAYFSNTYPAWVLEYTIAQKTCPFAVLARDTMGTHAAFFDKSIGSNTPAPIDSAIRAALILAKLEDAPVIAEFGGVVMFVSKDDFAGKHASDWRNKQADMAAMRKLVRKTKSIEQSHLQDGFEDTLLLPYRC